jgi:hypothetical protein
MMPIYFVNIFVYKISNAKTTNLIAIFAVAICGARRADFTREDLAGKFALG